MAYRPIFPKSDNVLLSDISQNIERISDDVQRSNSNNDLKISDIKSFISERMNRLENKMNATDDLINGYMDKLNKKMEKIPDNIKNDFSTSKVQQQLPTDYQMNIVENDDFENLDEKESKSVVKRMVGVLKRAGFKIQEKANEEGGFKELMKKIMYNIGGFFANMYTIKSGFEAGTKNLPGWLRTIIYHVYNGGINILSGVLNFTTSPLLRTISAMAGAPWTDNDQNKLNSIIDLLRLNPDFNGGNKAIEFGVSVVKNITGSIIKAIENLPLFKGLSGIKDDLGKIFDLVKSITPSGIKETFANMKDSVLGWFKKDNKDEELAEQTKLENDSKAEINDIESKNESQTQQTQMSIDKDQITEDINKVKIENSKPENDLKIENKIQDVEIEEPEEKSDDKVVSVLSNKIDKLSDLVVMLSKSIISQNSDNAEAVMSGIQQSSNAAFSNSISKREGQ